MKIRIQIQKEIDLREVICYLLCNGLCYFSDYGVDLNYSQNDYKLAKASSSLSAPAWEDVLTEMVINGKPLHFKDVEGEGDMDADLTLQSVKEGFEKMYGVNPTFTDAVDTLLKENEDAETCDVILQCLLYGDVVFG